MATVLIVDDDNEIRRTLRLLLEDAEHTVADARDGAEALTVLRASAAPTVVLLDLIMPGVNGVGFLEGVKADPTLARRHAFLLMTADGGTALSRATGLMADLAVELLPKPFDVDDLLDAVARADRHLSSGGPA